jgi:hypothetical protein
MNYRLITYINGEKTEIGSIPLSHFTPEVCDMAIKVNVPSETKTVELKLYWMVMAGGGNGGGGASYGFGATLDEACDEIITIRAWGNSGYNELKPLIIEAGYKTENKKDCNTYAYTRKMKTSASNNLYTTSIGDTSKPNYIEVYCGKRLVKTIGTKNKSNNNFDEVGTQTWYNGVWQSNGSEDKTPVTFESYSDPILVVPFISNKPDTSKVEEKYRYFPCIYVNGTKYYHGMKTITPDVVVNSYKSLVPDSVANSIDAEITSNSNITTVANKLPISNWLIKGSEIHFGAKNDTTGYATQNVICVENGQTTYKTLGLEYTRGANVQVNQVFHRNSNGELIAAALVAFNTKTGEVLATDIIGSGTIVNYGNGNFGIQDSSGLTTVNSGGGSTLVGNSSSASGGGGLSYSYLQNMGNGYHMLYGSDGRNYLYDSSNGTYKPLN